MTQLEMPQFGPLGRTTTYIDTYAPDLLFPVPRSMARDRIGMEGPLPFDGEDIWTGFELSWLNGRGKPEVALAEFRFPCTTSHLVESKSFKLYLMSFIQTPFESWDQVRSTLEKDLSSTANGPVKVTLTSLHTPLSVSDLAGTCVDHLDIETSIYTPSPELLKTSSDPVEETLTSHLLKSNCLATGQPDWGSVQIRYAGPRLDRAALLKYIISYRTHSGFAEHCVEQMFWDIWTRCRPQKLSVYARYTRRGGLDINPFRSSFEGAPENVRLARQ